MVKMLNCSWINVQSQTDNKKKDWNFSTNKVILKSYKPDMMNFFYHAI